jgi:uncharacterized membrane protein YccF (DUF307 family)
VPRVGREDHAQGDLVRFAGLWLAITHAITGVALCLTIIGIPFGIANTRLAAATVAPLGNDIVSTSDARVLVSPF